jgi:hypothetical protein
VIVRANDPESWTAETMLLPSSNITSCFTQPAYPP